MMLLIAASATAQPSVDLGLTSNMSATAKFSYEVLVRQVSLEGSVRVNVETFQVTPSITAGPQWETQRGSFKLFAGAYYHTVKPADKELIHKPVTWGGGARLEVNQGTVGIEYNGLYASLTVGFIFRKQE